MTRDQKPKTVWQWLLAYPALAIALIPPVVELVKSRMHDVPYGLSADAELQLALWNKNLRCIQAPFVGVINEFNVQTDATVCESGDVLVRFVGPKDRQAYRWVPVEQFKEPGGASFSLIGNAKAAGLSEAAVNQQTTVCQWSRPDGWIIRRVKKDGICHNEYIWAASGQVRRTELVDCKAPCQ